MSLKDPNVVSKDHKKRVAIVIANPAISTTTGWPVGFWWSELTHPYLAFDEKGYEVEIFRPGGGKCEADAMSDPRDASGYSSSDLITMGFIATARLAALVENTRRAVRLQCSPLTGRRNSIRSSSSSTSTEGSRARSVTVWRSFATRSFATGSF